MKNKKPLWTVPGTVIRYLLYTMVGKIVKHGRRTVLKIWTGDRGGTLFASVMKRLELLQSMPD